LRRGLQAFATRNFRRALGQAKLVLLDTIGCGPAAIDDGSARAVLATLASFGDKPRCTVIRPARKAARERIVEVVMTLDEAKTCEDLFRAVTPRAPATATLD
jgi:2-methylcitrate dehydratase PrpD